MSLIVSSLYSGIVALLNGRPITTFPNTAAEYIRKAVLELTEDYKHPLLEVTGPLFNFVAYQNSYVPSFFLQSADSALDVSKVNSFFIYINGYAVPSSLNPNSNAGYDLKFRSFDSIETLLSIPGMPMYWSRNNNQILIASMPDNTYTGYMRYQKQHPSTETPGGFGDTTPILMADSWQEILEYAAAIRLAPQVNLANKKAELHTSLYGDQKFQTSSGIEGSPGLIFQRTSQRNRDQSTTVRRMRLRMGRV